MKVKSKIIKTVIAMLTVLLFFFAQGAVVVINQMDGVKSAAVRGCVIWSLVIITLLYYGIRYKSIKNLGFRKPVDNSFKRTMYYIPPLMIALTNLAGGLDLKSGFAIIAANLFLTLGIGFAEEIYFRGIICNLWLSISTKKAVIISSALFGVCHILNAVGGAGIAETLLQICFALVYGVAFALIFIICKSIIPCIVLHTLHDFCSFISQSGELWLNIAVGAVQFTVLLCYAVLLIKRKDESKHIR